MMKHRTRFAASIVLLASAAGADTGSGLNGTWISEGSQEHRTLILKSDGVGSFFSDHPAGVCAAELEVTFDGSFAVASGAAPNCQQKGKNRL